MKAWRIVTKGILKNRQNDERVKDILISFSLLR